MTDGFQRVGDWDAAYDNRAAVPGVQAILDGWANRSAAAREQLADRALLDLAYGDHPRARLDLFQPQGPSRGLFVFVHGGYWKSLDKSLWSHLAAGALAHGFTVAVPGYPLCPERRIAQITAAIGQAIGLAADRAEGPIVLAGHSAGGHLVSRMLCQGGPLAGAVTARIREGVSISGVHDLRPLLTTAMNQTLRLDPAEAAAESPALLAPLAGTRLTCLAGGDELPEFRRQNALLANIWRGLGAETRALETPGRNHFDVVEDLADAKSTLCKGLFI